MQFWMYLDPDADPAALLALIAGFFAERGFSSSETDGHPEGRCGILVHNKLWADAFVMQKEADPRRDDAVYLNSEYGIRIGTELRGQLYPVCSKYEFCGMLACLLQNVRGDMYVRNEWDHDILIRCGKQLTLDERWKQYFHDRRKRMAAIFSIRRNDPPEEQVSISDTGTNVLLTVLVLAGSALAETDSQRRLIVWLAEQKLNEGICRGFSLADMPWDEDSFEADRQFMVRTADAASQRTGWQTLNFWPNAKALMPMLGWFRKGFVRLKAADTDPFVLKRWLGEMDADDPSLNGFPRCKKHKAYLTWNGCIACKQD